MRRSGTGGAGRKPSRSWGLGGWWLAAVCLLMSVRAPMVAAPTVITGERGLPTHRLVVNMRGMAELEKRRHLTNAVPKVVPNHSPFRTDGAGPIHNAARPAAAPSSGVAAPAAEGGTAGGSAQSTLPADSFQALDDAGFAIPPDTHGAAGPDHLMTTLNTQVRVQLRDGTVLSTMLLNNFWSALGNPDCFDPKILYDHMAGRWMFTAMADGFSPSSSILIGVSQTSDPTGNWNLFRVDADANDLDWADYPSIGFNKDWIVVSVNMFPIFAGGVSVQMLVFDKADLYANGTGAFTRLFDTGGGFTHVPAITFDDTLDRIYLVEVDNFLNLVQNGLRISTITGAVGSEVLTLGTAFASNATNTWIGFEAGFGGSAPQNGSSARIECNDSRIQNVVYRNGALWTTHGVYLSDNNPNNLDNQHAAVQWWQLDPSSGTILQFGRIDDPDGIVFYGFPSIAVNSGDDVLIGYSKFSPTEYASANYSYRAGIDPPNTMQSDIVLKAGEAPYFKTFSSGENRWGDYSATMVDPVNDIDMWTIQEYAASQTAQGTSRWGTWWGRIDVANASAFRIQFSSQNYTVREESPGFATITVLNVGGAPGSVEYATSDGTAVAGVDYLPATGMLTFGAGQSSTNFSVRILDNAVVNSNKTINLALANATGGAALSFPTNAVLTIIDDETRTFKSEAGEFNFSSYLNIGFPYLCTEFETFVFPCGRELYTFFTPERTADGALVTIVRTNGARGRVMVQFSTALGGSAIPFVDYLPITTNLVFADYQMATNVIIPVGSDFLTNGPKTVRLVLSDPVPDPSEEMMRPGAIRPTLGPGQESFLIIFESMGSFTNNMVGFERFNWRTDEYETYNLPGGFKLLNIQVIYPAASGGTVTFRMYNRVEGLPFIAGDDIAE